jgi:hypothetical protein
MGEKEVHSSEDTELQTNTSYFSAANTADEILKLKAATTASTKFDRTYFSDCNFGQREPQLQSYQEHLNLPANSVPEQGDANKNPPGHSIKQMRKTAHTRQANRSAGQSPAGQSPSMPIAQHAF